MEASAAAQFVAGFIDGDGCLTVPKPTKGNGALPRIHVAQSCDGGAPPELVFIANQYGGRIVEKPRVEGARRCWVLRIIKAKATAALLQHIADHAILKAPQARVIIEYLVSARDAATAESTRAKLALLKKSYAAVHVNGARLTDAYLAGFFAAEGSLGMYTATTGNVTLSATITQYGCARILESMRDALGYGSVVGGRQLRLSCGQAMAFFERIGPHLVGQKKAQVDLAVEYHRRRAAANGKKRTEEEKIEMKETAERLKVLKKQ